MHSALCSVRHERTASPRSTRRRNCGSTIACRDPSLISIPCDRRVAWTRKASLQPHFTPSVATPRPEFTRAIPSRISRSNASLACGGSGTHGAPALSSSGSDARAASHATCIRPRCTANCTPLPFVPDLRAAISDGYVAASNIAGAADQSSTASRLARSISRRLTPPTASDRQSFDGTSSERTPFSLRSW